MKIEYRADGVALEGYVVVFNRDSRSIADPLSGEFYHEQIMDGTFGPELRRKEIPVLLDHDRSRKLGTSRTNFSFEEDAIGLHVKAFVTDPEVTRKAKEGKLQGWSFAFSKFEFAREPMHLGKHRRLINKFELEEISLIDDRKQPCYVGTIVNVLGTNMDGHAEPMIRRPGAYKTYADRIAKLNAKPYKDRIKVLENK